MDERDKVDPLKELGDRLDRARAAQRPAPAPAPADPGTNAALARGWRVGLELVVAVAVGAFIGWAVDEALGTRPWGMIVFFLPRHRGGMWNVYRAVKGLGMAVGYRHDADDAAGGRRLGRRGLKWR